MQIIILFVFVLFAIEGQTAPVKNNFDFIPNKRKTKILQKLYLKCFLEFKNSRSIGYHPIPPLFPKYPYQNGVIPGVGHVAGISSGALPIQLIAAASNPTGQAPGAVHPSLLASGVYDPTKLNFGTYDPTGGLASGMVDPTGLVNAFGNPTHLMNNKQNFLHK